MPTRIVKPCPSGPVRLLHPPTRPASGGPEIWLPPEPEGWVVEPKYNGHRMVVDCEGLKQYSRHLTPYGNYNGVIDPCPLTERCTEKYIRFIDMEAMGPRSREHAYVNIIFDIYGVQSNTRERRDLLLSLGFPVHDPFEQSLLNRPCITPGMIAVVPQYPATCAGELFHLLQLLPGDVFEGVVLKQIANPYPRNRWIKFRFDQYQNAA